MAGPRIRFTLGELMGLIMAVAVVLSLIPAPWGIEYSVVLIAFAVCIALLPNTTRRYRPATPRGLRGLCRPARRGHNNGRPATKRLEM
jgi:hypothetical protein